ncbi:unnamed protein product [Chrysoparadoxa australica]
MSLLGRSRSLLICSLPLLCSRSFGFVLGGAPGERAMSCCGAAGSATAESTRESVKEYYGKILNKSDDLKTNACTTDSGLPDHIKGVLRKVNPEVISKYYGCGICVPEQLEGCNVLDLGCGAGRDCYILASLVGEKGSVVGVDMTDEQLEVANKHIDYHKEAFGYSKANTEFKKGYIEKLDELNLPDNHFDIIVSNCVINLSPDKDAVLREAYRVLKPGGELYFSDVYSDKRVPDHLVKDPVLFGECLSGALYWNDFLTLSRKHGFNDPRLVSDSRITISNPSIEAKVGHIGFYSATYRLFKLPELETDCEDYGEAVIYKGTLPTQPLAFKLDNHHTIEKGRVFPVCRNTLHMLQGTRFKKHFDVVGGGETHFGLFEGCGKSIPFTSATPAAPSTGSCAPSSSSGGGGCC